MLKKILGTLSVLASLVLLLCLAPLDLAKSEGVKSKSACKTVLLYFYWEKCGACRQMAPFVDEAEKALKKEGIKVKRFEVYDPNVTSIVREFQFKTVPAFFLLGESGGKTSKIKIQSSGQNLKESVLSTASQFRSERGC